jgi:hypothetical protein
LAALCPSFAIVVRLLIKSAAIESLFEIYHNRALAFITPDVSDFAKDRRTQGKDRDCDEQEEEIENGIEDGEGKLAVLEIAACQVQCAAEHNCGYAEGDDHPYEDRCVERRQVEIIDNNNADNYERADGTDGAQAECREPDRVEEP